MAFLVTGSHGCIGAWVLKTLVAAGERPVAYDLAEDPWRFRTLGEPDEVARATFVRGDVTDVAALTRVVAEHGVTRIIHLAAFQIPLCRQDPPNQRDLGPHPTTPLRDGVRQTIERFERLLRAAALDTRELG